MCRSCSFAESTSTYIGNQAKTDLKTLAECKVACMEDNHCRGIIYGKPKSFNATCCAGECWLDYGTSLETYYHAGFDVYIIPGRGK